MKAEKFFEELELLVQKKGYRIRKELGDFKGGNCIMHGERLIVLNKKIPVESHIAVLAKFLYENGLTDEFTTPAVRKELIQIWKKYPDYISRQSDDLDL